MANIERWFNTWRALGIPPSNQLRELYAEIIARYSEPHRHYHTVQHLAECFEQWSSLRSHAPHAGEVELALWFHDAIYDTQRSDNEAESAQLAEKAALDLGVAADSAGRIHSLVMATRHAAEPVGPDAELLVDTDLSILGAEPARFDRYEQQIRQEYAWVPETTFRERRTTVLKEFLSRPHIYSTNLFRTRYEAQACANLKRSLAALK
jgi:predicted metal-dependent HD superfamily phosphohydrolase